MSIQLTGALRVGVALTAATIGAVPGACSAQRASTERVVLYSPPTRLGGAGRLISLPASLQPTVVDARTRRPSLERADAKPTAATRSWLAGTWLLHATKDDLDRDACSSDTPVAFDRDGTLRFSEGAGRWSLQGSTLVQTITRASANADPDLLGDIGRPQRTPITRVGPDEGALLVDGVSMSMLRCRHGDAR